MKEQGTVSKAKVKKSMFNCNIRKMICEFLICVLIIVIAILVDYVIQTLIYYTHMEIVDDDFSNVFHVDSIKCTDKELILDGWVFELEKDSIDDDFDVILYDYNNAKEYYMDIEDKCREDVNEYFRCKYNYSHSGFVASIEIDKIDLNENNYEVLIRTKGKKQAYKSETYISKGEMLFVKPEDYVPLDVVGTDLEEIVNDGVLRVYRPDVGMYVYQYDGILYWIADESYEFEKDGSTFMEYQMNTTQIEKLPQYRLDNNWFWSNIGFDFETNEITDKKIGKYRVTVSALPKEYSITEMWIGYYIDGCWIWEQHFRPWYSEWWLNNGTDIGI